MGGFCFVVEMTGQNGHSNGDNSHPPASTWTVGLVNSALKYLTAETFGFKVWSLITVCFDCPLATCELKIGVIMVHYFRLKVNANGLALKKKQLWTLEAFGDSTDAVSFRSHLDKYLSVDQVGEKGRSPTCHYGRSI